MQKEQPSLVLLDVMMPGIDGFQTCQRMRDFTRMPIIMITAKGGVEDVVHGLDVGADDYITKPFSITEMLARVKAVLQRAKFPQETAQPPFVSGQLCIDFAHHQVTLAGEEIMLPPTEYRILCLLARNAGRVITHDQLLTEVWGRNTAATRTYSRWPWPDCGRSWAMIPAIPNTWPPGRASATPSRSRGKTRRRKRWPAPPRSRPRSRRPRSPHGPPHGIA